MFIVHRGRVNIQVKENGIGRTITTLHAGDFFGEMSLFSGDPRTADVVADTETKVIEISQQILKPLFEGNPELVKVIAEIIEERRQALDEAEEDLQSIAEDDLGGPVNKLKRFFGLD